MRDIAVLASGNGSNLQAIINAINSGRLDARISLVISDRESAYAVTRARNSGIDCRVMVRKTDNREAYFDEVRTVIEEYNPDLIVLAGFMKILPPSFVEHFINRIINIHPSLLPCFGGKGLYGTKVHRAVIDSGSRVTGCTVHFVSNEVDGGPIIEQRTMGVWDSDTPQSLAERIHEIEHEALLYSISLVLSGDYTISGKRVIRKPK